MSWGNILINFTRRYLLILYNLDLQLLVGDNSTKNGALWNNDKLSYNCLKMRCSGKMAPPYENRVNPHSQHRQNFSSGPGTSNFWTLVAKDKCRLSNILSPNWELGDHWSMVEIHVLAIQLLHHSVLLKIEEQQANAKPKEQTGTKSLRNKTFSNFFVVCSSTQLAILI